MTCICSKDKKFKVYDIDMTCGECELKNHFDECFQVDTLIASSVALLNEKGYITECSCSEHFHNKIEYDSYPPNEIPSGTLLAIPKDELMECYTDIPIYPQKTVIRFRDKQYFSTLPRDWTMEEDICLSYTYEKNLSEFDFYNQQVMAIKQLYEWVVDLESEEIQK